jgi:hypothetical protein
MGAAADLKLTEIKGTRRQLEDDLRELEARLPAPLRSAKSVAGIALGSTVLTAFILRKMQSKRSNGHHTAEVVVRIVREDE